MLFANRRQPVISTARVVMPRVPAYVHRPHEVDVRIKVDPRGRVSSIAANYGDDPLRNRLSALAADAINKWQFEPVAVNSYRDARVRLLFTPRGVSIARSM